MPTTTDLLAVSHGDDWTAWCRFFLEAIRAQAEDNLAKTQAILALYEEMKRRVPEMTRSQYAIRALDWIFERRFSVVRTLLSRQ